MHVIENNYYYINILQSENNYKIRHEAKQQDMTHRPIIVICIYIINIDFL